MRNVVGILVLSAGLMLIASSPTLAGDAPRKCLDQYNLASGSLALQGYSPVSYFTAGAAQKGNPQHAVSYRGVTYWLTDAEQVRVFNQNPAKYEPAFGGWCAYGAAVEKKLPIDPENFKIVDGRLFLFLKNDQVDALKLWDKEDQKTFTVRADTWWSKVVEQ